MRVTAYGWESFRSDSNADYIFWAGLNTIANQCGLGSDLEFSTQGGTLQSCSQIYCPS